jgi:hypothetical protein
MKFSQYEFIFPPLPRGIELGRACADIELLKRLDHYYYSVHFPAAIGGDIFFVYRRLWSGILQQNCTPLGYAIARLLFAENTTLAEYKRLLETYENERWRNTFLPYPVGHPRSGKAVENLYTQEQLNAAIAENRESAVEEYKRFRAALDDIIQPMLYNQADLDSAVEQAKIEAVEEYKAALEPTQGLKVNASILGDKPSRFSNGEIDLERLKRESLEATLDEVVSPGNLLSIAYKVLEAKRGPKAVEQLKEKNRIFREERLKDPILAKALSDIGKN